MLLSFAQLYQPVYIYDNQSPVHKSRRIRADYESINHKNNTTCGINDSKPLYRGHEHRYNHKKRPKVSLIVKVVVSKKLLKFCYYHVPLACPVLP